MGLFDFLSNKKKETAVCKDLPLKIEDLSKNDTFSIEISGINEISGKTFQVNDFCEQIIHTDNGKTLIINIEDLSSGEPFRISPFNINGKSCYKIQKELFPDDVETLFFDPSWIYDENNFTPPNDFRFIFDESCHADFCLVRYSENTKDKHFEWTSNKYSFYEHTGVQGYKFPSFINKDSAQKNETAISIQSYSLADISKKFFIDIEVYQDGVTKVYLGHIVGESMINDIFHNI